MVVKEHVGIKVIKITRHKEPAVKTTYTGRILKIMILIHIEPRNNLRLLIIIGSAGSRLSLGLSLTACGRFGFTLSQSSFCFCNSFLASNPLLLSLLCGIGSGEELIIVDAADVLRCLARS